MRVSVVSLIVFSGLVLPAMANPVPSYKSGEPYASYRDRLVNGVGYSPFDLSKKGMNRCSPGRDECEKWSETIYCSGTGMAKCEFIVVNKAQTLLIETYGEDTLVKKVREISERETDRILTKP